MSPLSAHFETLFLNNLRFILKVSKKRLYLCGLCFVFICLVVFTLKMQIGKNNLVSTLKFLTVCGLYFTSEKIRK